MDGAVITEDRLMREIERVRAGLEEAEAADYRSRFPGSPIEPDKVTVKPRKKYVALDIGISGAFLVERATGELFNIKGYGVPDKNKKRKADIGNVFTADPAGLWRKRYNYLR